MQIGLFQGKTGKCDFYLPAPSVLSPGKQQWQVHRSLSRNVSFWLLSSGSHGCKPYTFSGLGVLGACSTCGSLKSWGIRCGIQTLHSPGRSWELEDPPRLYGSVPGVGFIVRECLSLSYTLQCGWCGYFLICPVCRSCSASFQISCRENCSVCSYRSVCPMSMGGGEFRSLLCHHLVLYWKASYGFNNNLDILLHGS